MYRTIDLCAGIGGIRKGFERTGHFNNVLSAEIDEYAARTYEANFIGDNPRNDLTSRQFKDSLQLGMYDVLLAGFPCQPFSSQGNLEGFGDPTKGTIFFHIKQIIKRTRPKAIFLENVQNIVSHDKGNTIHTILDSLEKKLNYKVIGVSLNEEGRFDYKHSTFVRNTKDFGLPQNRPRAYFIAFDKELYGDLVYALPDKVPTGLSDRLLANPHLQLPLEQLLDHDVDIHYYMSATYLTTLENHIKRQKKNGNGFGYCIVNSLEREKQIANAILATGGSGKERNLIHQEMPQYEYDDHIRRVVERKKGGINTKNIRIMTPTEWGRLQGFIGYGFLDEQTSNDTFFFPNNVPESQQYKQFGNSVSIPVIETMADFLYECLVTMNNDYRIVLKNYAKRTGFISRQSVRECLDIEESRASRLLRNMVSEGIVIQEGQGRNTKYYFV